MGVSRISVNGTANRLWSVMGGINSMGSGNIGQVSFSAFIIVRTEGFKFSSLPNLTFGSIFFHIF